MFARSLASRASPPGPILILLLHYIKNARSLTRTDGCCGPVHAWAFFQGDSSTRPAESSATDAWWQRRERRLSYMIVIT
ncbi:hypothetical protein BDZ88DRAFT_407437 [Geranomyces variabilis]|nr:hypothetical protein BDZ88DRAFT_407437 [Geranomyces variabilis]